MTTIVDVLRERGIEQPDRLAFEFVDEGEITYGELDARARAIAAMLRACGPAGERALLVYPPGLAFIEALFGCLYAGWIAVPAAPPSRHERLDRLCAIARDAEPRLVLTTERLRARLGDVGVLTTTDAVDDDAGFVSAVAPKDVAILQYTSGSTGSPRGGGA